ncbi:ATP-binding cassette domain-containing protein [Patescibacteria group bacterium]
MIKVENLTKKFGENLALDNISFEIKKGEVLGFLGPNGAGKTTTMRILTGLIAPTSGNIKVQNLNILDNSLEIRKLMGYLPETVPLYEEMKVFEYLKFIAEMKGLRNNQIVDKIRKISDLCGLKRVIRQPIGELSKGFRQRVGLAQAMINEPEILVLDEPTSGLDPNQIVEIRNLIKKIGENQTVILSTHILQEVSATCDRVVIINNGKIVAKGTTNELISKANRKEILYVKIKGPYAEIMEKLKLMENVEDVKKQDKEDENIFGYQITVDGEADIREYVFMTIVKNNWSLLEMNREAVSLEDVFRELTVE